MFSFLKFRQKSKLEAFEQLYQHAGQNGLNWLSVAINKNTFAGSLFTKELEILTENDAFHLKMAESKSGPLHQVWQNQRALLKDFVPMNPVFIEKFNHLLDQIIEKQIVNFQHLLNTHLTTKPFSEAEISQDEKALEWMRVSFKILEKAIAESLTNPEYLFQTLLFMGINPKTQMKEIRVITFNLDIQFLFLDNGMLRIRIYNDKDGDLGSSKKAAVEGDFNFRKREMLDELTKIISVLSMGLKSY